jgi:hypothetical protein
MILAAARQIALSRRSLAPQADPGDEPSSVTDIQEIARARAAIRRGCAAAHDLARIVHTASDSEPCAGRARPDSEENHD